jgi:hypothetical protein
MNFQPVFKPRLKSRSEPMCKPLFWAGADVRLEVEARLNFIES